MSDRSFDRILVRGRVSVDERVARVRNKSWHIGQCAVAAALAWYLAHDVVGHPQPFFAPIVAVVCLGTSYGQRLRKVFEVAVGRCQVARYTSGKKLVMYAGSSL